MTLNPLLAMSLTWKPQKERLTKPYYQSIADMVEEDIESGILSAGTKMPPQRQLADFLELNFTTITRAYKILTLKGVLTTVEGSGTFVAGNKHQSISLGNDELKHEEIDLGFVSFVEDTNSYVKEAVAEVLKNPQMPMLLDYSNPTGMPHQKETAIKWLSKINVSAQKENMCITQGTHNAITISLLSLFKAGDIIAVDTHAFINFIEIARLSKLRLVPISFDQEGMSPYDLLSKHLQQGIQGVYLNPSCGNPTTLMISEKRKQELARVIVDNNILLIEDDINAFFTASVVKSYEGPIQRYAPNHTVYISGTSKPICSGLRIAYMCYPPRLKSTIENGLFNLNVKTTALDAEIITTMINDGIALKILKAKIQRTIKRNEIFNLIFGKDPNNYCPVSMYRWLGIESSLDANSLENYLLEKGVRVYHGDRFKVGPQNEKKYIRLALTTAKSEDELRHGLEIVKHALSLI